MESKHIIDLRQIEHLACVCVPLCVCAVGLGAGEGLGDPNANWRG